LLLDNDFFYPKIGIPNRNYGQHYIAKYFDKSKFYDNGETINALLKNIQSSENQNILLSSEAFCLLNQMEIDHLISTFHEYNIKVLLFLRETEEWLISSWKKRISLGKEKRSLISYAKVNIQRASFSYYESMWKEIFKHVYYHKDTDPLNLFIDALALKKITINNNKRVNEGSRIEHLFVQRFFPKIRIIRSLGFYMSNTGMMKFIAKRWYDMELQRLKNHLN